MFLAIKIQCDDASACACAIAYPRGLLGIAHSGHVFCEGRGMIWRCVRTCAAQKMDDENKKITTNEPPRYGSLQTPSPPSSGDSYKVYPGRFYVLIVFTLVVLLQSFAWMTFGTIPDESLKHFGLTDDDIALIAGKSSYVIAFYNRSTCQYRVLEVGLSSAFGKPWFLFRSAPPTIIHGVPSAIQSMS